jgi:hypothetical protein
MTTRAAATVATTALVAAVSSTTSSGDRPVPSATTRVIWRRPTVGLMVRLSSKGAAPETRSGWIKDVIHGVP